MCSAGPFSENTGPDSVNVPLTQIFLWEIFEVIAEQRHWITENRNWALLLNILFNDVQLMFSFGQDDYTTLGFQLSSGCLLWCFNSMTKVQWCWWDKNQLWCSIFYDILTVWFRSIVFSELEKHFCFKFTPSRLLFFKTFTFKTVSRFFLLLQVSEVSFYSYQNQVETKYENLK